MKRLIPLGALVNLVAILALLLSCASNRPATELIPVEKLPSLGLEINDSLHLDTLDMDIVIWRPSKEYYAITRNDPDKGRPRKQKVVNNNFTFIKDKSQENSGNKYKSADKDKAKDKSGQHHKDKSQVDSGNKAKTVKKSGGLPWWLWVLILAAVLVLLFYNQIKQRLPLFIRNMLPVLAITLLISCTPYNKGSYPIGGRVFVMMKDSTLREAYIRAHKIFWLEIASDTGRNPYTGMVRPKFIYRPMNVYNLADVIRAREALADSLSSHPSY